MLSADAKMPLMTEKVSLAAKTSFTNLRLAIVSPPVCLFPVQGGRLKVLLVHSLRGVFQASFVRNASTALNAQCPCLLDREESD